MNCDCVCYVGECVCVCGNFDLHFSCLVCILFPSSNKLLMRQAGHSQKRMRTMRLHKNTVLSATTLAGTRTKTHAFITRDPQRYTSASLHASLCLFITSGESRVNQLFFDWFDLVLTVCSKAHMSAARSSNGLHFMQQQTQLSMFTLFSTSSLALCVYMPPLPPSLHPCSAAVRIRCLMH